MYLNTLKLAKLNIHL